MWFVTRHVLGVLCLGLGLVALVTPLTPGAWLILVGVELLGLHFLLPKKVQTKWEAWKQMMKKKVGW